MIDSTFWQDFLRLVTLQDANTRTVLLATVMLGTAAGIVGCFSLLRKRALIGDALSHAALPGICIAFIIAGEKNTPALLLGALIAGILGILCITALRSLSRISEDAAIGIVLSTFFGLGIALSSLIQQANIGNISGIETFLYGKAAAMLSGDVVIIAATSVLTIAIVALAFKEFLLICFDREFASATGWPTTRIDLLLMSLIVAIVIVGLQAVGVVLIIALLIAPPATARLWTDDLKQMLLLSGLFGGLSGLIGTVLSALLPKLPTGAIIVSVAASFFFFSFLFARKQGVLARYFLRRRRLRHAAMDHLLRFAFERLESRSSTADTFSADEISHNHGWKTAHLNKVLSRALNKDLLFKGPEKDTFGLTPLGLNYARSIVRRHRLWELFLISEAAIRPSHADISADTIEHALNPTLLALLEEQLRQRYPDLANDLPPSPHQFKGGL